MQQLQLKQDWFTRKRRFRIGCSRKFWLAIRDGAVRIRRSQNSNRATEATQSSVPPSNSDAQFKNLSEIDSIHKVSGTSAQA
jgi:hypothetical protein